MMQRRCKAKGAGGETMVRSYGIVVIVSISLFTVFPTWPSKSTSGQPEPVSTVSTLDSLPFGPKQLPTRLFGCGPFTGAYVNAGSASTLIERLRIARAARMHLILKLAGDKKLIQNSDKSFSLGLWKRNIDRLRGIDLKPFVADGTVIGAELFNEPHVRGKWGGKVVTKEELEGAAAYAKSIWPYLPVGAGRSDYLLKYAPWKHLDFGHSQYHMRKGDIEDWRRKTVEESKAAGVALVLSLNFYGGEEGNRPMTPEEIRKFGSVLAADTYACALTGWVYDEKYFSEPGIAEAFAKVASMAASHPAPPCYIGAVKP
jgi:hypothetical protein